MAYTKTTWVNNSQPYINADNLNKIENQLESNTSNIETNTANIQTNTNKIAQLSGQILWTNSSPTSNISTSTNMSLNSSDYDILEIVYLLYNNNTYYNSVKTLKGGNARIFALAGSSFSYRNITRNSDTSYTIGTDSSSAGNNIPVYVIGYKTGLF